MLDYQVNAINAVREYAIARNAEYQILVEDLCKPFDVDVNVLVEQVLSCPVTLNFHLDRLSNNGK